MSDILPQTFMRFGAPLDPLLRMQPVAIAHAGSYGNPGKSTDSLSDLDILFVFRTQCIISVLRQYIDALSLEEQLIVLYLGIHPQFGHLVNMCFADDPLRWVDVGIMDENFARNYLTHLPVTVLRGEIRTCGIPPSPENQMAHLAKKIAKARQRKDDDLFTVYCHRYLQWANIEASHSGCAKRTIASVLEDINRRFPYVATGNER